MAPNGYLPRQQSLCQRHDSGSNDKLDRRRSCRVLIELEYHICAFLTFMLLDLHVPRVCLCHIHVRVLVRVRVSVRT